MIKASLTNYRQSPRKVRLVADAIRGKSVSDALRTLSVVAKRATGPIEKLIESAVSNAKHNFNISAENLFVKEVRVDAGVSMKRSMPRARGSAYPVRKRSSHVLLVLDEKAPAVKTSKKTVK